MQSTPAILMSRLLPCSWNSFTNNCTGARHVYKSLTGTGDLLDELYAAITGISHDETAIAKIQSYGIDVYGTFIVGLGGNDTSVFQMTRNFIKNNYLYGVNITVPTPLPGTALREKMLQENRVLTNDWSYYTFWVVTIQTKKMQMTQLEEGLLHLYENLYTDTLIAQRLTHMKTLAKSRKRIIEASHQ